MPPKKKKTQLKPVARGFATTSVPKKVVEVPPEPETPETNDAAGTLSTQNETSATKDQAGNAAEPTTLSETEQALQSFIDKFQDKVEKDVVRAVKVCCQPIVLVFSIFMNGFAGH